MEINRKNAVRQSRGTHFVRACAVETNMDISEQPFCVELYRENAGLKHRALTLTIRTPQCGHTVWGIKIRTTIQQLRIAMENP